MTTALLNFKIYQIGQLMPACLLRASSRAGAWSD
jgi:hypothetical protein